MTDDDPPYLVQLSQRQEEAAMWLFYSLPENGWETCCLEYRKAGAVGESVVRCTLLDGTV